MHASVYRVHWLRAKALYDRAHEEATIVEHEMGWTTSYFKFQQRTWGDRAAQTIQQSLGHTAYAFQQAAIYQQFAEQAADAFTKTRNQYIVRRLH
jgi:hypothetical protein